MSTLRNRLIRLAFEEPDLRGDLLPLLARVEPQRLRRQNRPPIVTTDPEPLQTEADSVNREAWELWMTLRTEMDRRFGDDGIMNLASDDDVYSVLEEVWREWMQKLHPLVAKARETQVAETEQKKRELEYREDRGMLLPDF